MAIAANITRRAALKALPFITAAVPAAACTPAMTARERMAHHLEEFRRAAVEVDPTLSAWSFQCDVDSEIKGGCGVLVSAFRATTGA